jgi:hypothetical protein
MRRHGESPDVATVSSKVITICVLMKSVIICTMKNTRYADEIKRIASYAPVIRFSALHVLVTVLIPPQGSEALAQAFKLP